jgi:hypothetical protein
MTANKSNLKLAPVAPSTTPVSFDEIVQGIEFLRREGPFAHCPGCGLSLDNQLEEYTVPDEMTRIKNLLLALSKAELVELFCLLPPGEEYDLARFVVSSGVRTNKWQRRPAVSTPRIRRAA